MTALNHPTRHRYRALATLAMAAVLGSSASGLAFSQPVSAATDSSSTSTPASTLGNAAKGVDSAKTQLAAAEKEVRDATRQATQLAYTVVAERAELVTVQLQVAASRAAARAAIQLVVDTSSEDPTVTLYATLEGDDPDLATQVTNRRLQDVETRSQKLNQDLAHLSALTQDTGVRQLAAISAARRAVAAADEARALLDSAEQKQLDVRSQLALEAQRKVLDQLNAQLLQTLQSLNSGLSVAPGSSGRANIIASSPAALQALFKRAVAAECPGLPWPVLAGISQVETDNGENKNVSSAGAMGPMQFMPATWAVYGVDGDGDGKADILDQADAVYSAAHYLCADGGGKPDTLYQAIYGYNHSDYYVNTVLGIAAQYKT